MDPDELYDLVDIARSIERVGDHTQATMASVPTTSARPRSRPTDRSRRPRSGDVFAVAGAQRAPTGAPFG